MNLTKVLGVRFQQCLGKFTMVLVERFYETRLLDIYVTNFSESVISEIQMLWGSSFFSKYLKFNLYFKNSAKNWEKVFCFWYNCIWTGIVKLYLLRIGYFSSAANVLISSPKIWHVSNRDFFQLSRLGKINESDKDVVMQISTMLGHVYHFACLWVLWNETC